MLSKLSAERIKRQLADGVKLERQLLEWFDEEDADPETAAQACMLFAARVAQKLGRSQNDFGRLAHTVYKALAATQESK